MPPAAAAGSKNVGASFSFSLPSILYWRAFMDGKQQQHQDRIGTKTERPMSGEAGKTSVAENKTAADRRLEGEHCCALQE